MYMRIADTLSTTLVITIGHIKGWVGLTIRNQASSILHTKRSCTEMQSEIKGVEREFLIRPINNRVSATAMHFSPLDDTINGLLMPKSLNP